MNKQNARDTKFAGFAKALVEDLFRFHALDGRTFVNQGDKIEQIVARRAYDLVEHACKNVNDDQARAGMILHPNAMLRAVKDMTELPKEEAPSKIEDMLKNAHEKALEIYEREGK